MNIKFSDGQFHPTDRQSPFAVRRYLLGGTVSVAALMAVSARADTTVNYNFTTADWVTNSAPTYPPDGGTVSGTMTFDWTNDTVVSAGFTTTASTSTGWTTQTFTNMAEDFTGNYTGATYTFNGTTYNNATIYAEVTGTAGGQTLFIDFTQGNTTDIFPGQLGVVYSSEEEYSPTSLSRVLALTVAVSAPPSTPINGTDASMDSSNLGGSLTPDFQGGTLIIVSGSASLSNNFNVEDFVGNTIDASGNPTILSGTLTGAGGLTFTDSSGLGSTVTLTNTGNTYSGTTSITSATLQAGANFVFSANSPVNLSDTATAALNLAGFDETIGGLSGGGASGGNVLLGSGTLTNTGGGTYGGTISGSGSFIQSAGTEVLTGVNVYTGTTTINLDATLALSGTGSIAASSGVTDNGTFDISASTGGAAITSLSGNGVVTLGPQTLTLTNAAGSFGGAIGGAGGIGVAGGTETLSGINSYTGATSISSGATLALSGSGSIAASSGVTDNGTFDLSATTGGAAITSLSGSGVVKLGAQTLTLSAAAGIFGGAIGGAGRLTFSGGTETLSGINGYSGATGISSGATLALTGTGSIASSSGVTDNGTFDLSATTGGVAITSLSGSGVVKLGAQTLTLTNAAGMFSGGIGGAGGIGVAVGTATLSGINGYTGATGISSNATLALAGSGSIAASSGVTDNGTFDISATTSGASIKTLSADGMVALGNKVLALTSASTTFSGAIAGGGGLAVTGGTQTLTGTSSYSGGTSVTNAALAINSDMALGGASGRVALNNATLTALASLNSTRVFTLTGGDTLVTANAVGLSGPIGGSGSLTLTGGGTGTLSGVNSYAGGTAIIGGTTLNVAADTALGAAAGGLTFNNGILVTTVGFNSARGVVLAGAGTVNTSGNVVALSGIASGSGGLTANGGGSLILSGVNSFSGGTTVIGGTTLKVGSDAALGAASGGITLGDTSSTGTLVALGSFTSNRNILVNAGGGLIEANGNILTLTGAITEIGVLNASGGPGGQVLFDGPTTVLNFVISNGMSNNTGTVNAAAGLVVNSNATFNNSGSVNAVTFVVDATANNTGTMNFSSSATVATGGLLSNDGTLNSPLLTVNGALRGTGTINAPTTVNGVLAPGNSPGTLTFSAPVTMTAGSTTQFDIDGTGTGTGAGNYSRVIVLGAADSFTAGGTLLPLLRGITGNATNSYTPLIGQQFELINAAGGIPVSSSYAGLIQPAGLAAGSRFDALYAPTMLTLVITPSAYGNLALAGIGQTSAEQSVGAALDALRPAAGVRMSSGTQSLFYPLYVLPGAAIPAALDDLSPLAYGDGVMAVRQSWYGTAATIGDQLADRRSGLATDKTAAGPNGSTVWLSGTGQFTDVSGTGATGYHVSSGGTMVGIDRALVPGSVVGVAVGGSSVQTSTSNGATVSADLVQFSIYGGMRSDRFFVDGQAAYVHADQDVRRSLGFAGTATRGNATADGGGGQVNGGMHFDVNRLKIEPPLG